MAKLDIEAVGRMGICVHEAAHAYVLHHYDIEIEHIKLEFSWWTGNLQGGYVTAAEDPGWESKFEGYAVTYPAGAIAMERFLLEEGMARYPAMSMAEYSGTYDREDLRDLLNGAVLMDPAPEISESWCHLRAEVLVDQYWGSIREVAEQLNVRNRLTASAVA